MNRKDQRQQWLAKHFNNHDFMLKAASEDASFRSYFRVSTQQKSYILMDAPPEHEDCRPFVAVQKLLAAHQVHVPELFAADVEQGFLLLEDFGDRLYLTALEEAADAPLADESSTDESPTVETLYQAAIDTLVQIQSITEAATQLPPYDEKLLMTEMQLFNDWFIGEHLGLKLDPMELAVVNQAYTLLTDNALSQPQVMVHRDYHSRNLMVVDAHPPGVIDFQDAVYGPLTYDLASLLKDCYITWPGETVENLCGYYLQQYNSKNNSSIELPQLMQWFELMAAQRHLKAIGIFCRLNYRDGKSTFLYDIPRTMNYLLVTSAKYPELEAFNLLLKSIQPVLAKGPTNP